MTEKHTERQRTNIKRPESTWTNEQLNSLRQQRKKVVRFFVVSMCGCGCCYIPFSRSLLRSAFVQKFASCVYILVCRFIGLLLMRWCVCACVLVPQHQRTKKEEERTLSVRDNKGKTNPTLTLPTPRYLFLIWQFVKALGYFENVFVSSSWI